jgi:glucans biosynthesis protein
MLEALKRLDELAGPQQFQKARQCGARTRSGKPCRSPATKKGRCRLHGGANGSGGPPGERNGQYRHGERTKAAIAERQKFSALLKMLRAGLT